MRLKNFLSNNYYKMGQRTQTIVKIIRKDGLEETKAFHNQWGYGYPLVITTLSAVDYGISLIKGEFYEYSMWEDIELLMKRPFGLDEIFNIHEGYECIFKPEGHDNDNGYGLVYIDCKNKRVDYNLYTHNGKLIGSKEYIEKENVEDFSTKEREDYIKKQQTKFSLFINNNKNNESKRVN